MSLSNCNDCIHYTASIDQRVYFRLTRDEQLDKAYVLDDFTDFPSCSIDGEDYQPFDSEEDDNNATCNKFAPYLSE